MRGCQSRGPSPWRQRFSVACVRAEQEALDGAAARHAMAEQTRGEDARVVDDQEIAGGEE